MNVCTSQESKSGLGRGQGQSPPALPSISMSTWGELVLHPTIQLAGQPTERSLEGSRSRFRDPCREKQPSSHPTCLLPATVP